MTVADLTALRTILHQSPDKPDPTLTVWSETLMRFCELRLPTLSKRSRHKWGGRREARTGLLHLAAFLADCNQAFADIRYLNTSLKLLDLTPLANFSSSIKGLPSHADDVHEVLLQTRILLITEAALTRLESST